MPFFTFGTGWVGRAFSALLEVIIIAIVLVIIAWALGMLGFALPAIIGTLVKVALVLYFFARVFGFVGPAV